MTNIIEFKRSSNRVEIQFGIITDIRITDHAGSRVIHEVIGTPRFFVDVVEDDGRIGMWDGPTYDTAILAAGEISRDFGYPVHDLVQPEDGRDT